MIHKRIRPFNTKVTYPEQNLDNDLSHAVVTRGGTTSGFAVPARKTLIRL